MVNQVDVDTLRLEIDELFRLYPDLADDDVLRADMLDGATDIREVVGGLARMLGEIKSLAGGLHSYIVDLTERRARYGRRQEFVRDLIFKIMESANLKKLELPDATLSMRNNPPHVVGDADPMFLADSLCIIKRTPNRTAIKEALEAGQEVPGFALSNAAPSLMVKVK